MVKDTAQKAIEPAKEFFTETGEMMILTGRTILSAIKPPYPYGNEFIGQFLFAAGETGAQPVGNVPDLSPRP